VRLAANVTGYALFPSTFTGGMQLLHLNAATGTVLDKHSVSGPFATYYRGYYGSATRVLPFDVESATFYLAASIHVIVILASRRHT